MEAGRSQWSYVLARRSRVNEDERAKVRGNRTTRCGQQSQSVDQERADGTQVREGRDTQAKVRSINDLLKEKGRKCG